MKGFTLIELSITILLLTILSTIIFYFSSLNRNFLYLKEFSRKLNNAFSVAGFLAQQTRNYQNQTVCAYGIYFPARIFKTIPTYETLAFTTTTNICDLAITPDRIQDFIQNNLNNKKYVHSNLEIRTTSLPELALSTLENVTTSISTSSDCSSSINPPILFMFVYSYTDMYFLYQQNGGQWQRINAPAVYICLDFRNDRIKIKVNKVGQFYIIE